MVIHGAAVDGDGVGPAAIEFHGDTITGFKRGAAPAGAVVYDPERYLIFPGFVDLFANDDSERLAAVSGGIVAARAAVGPLPPDAITPLHLFYDTDMLTAENRKFLVVRPRLGGRTARLGLLASVKSGTGADWLVSDHHAVTMDEKLRGSPGTPQFDTFGSFVTWLIVDHKVDPVRVWRLACYNPGMIVGADGRKLGRLVPGHEASITILDLQRSPLDSRPLISRAGWSPFDLRLLPGSVSVVYLRGQKVVDELYIRNDLPT